MVKEEIAQYTVGDPAREEIKMGPMVSASQREKVLQQLEQAKKSGANVEGGEVPNCDELAHGFFLSPALVIVEDDSIDLMREETFGPVVACQIVDSAWDAIEKANQLEFGLGGTIWGEESPELEKLALKIESGMVGVNRTIGGAPGMPFVGNKSSTLGYYGGISGMRQFTELRCVSRNL